MLLTIPINHHSPVHSTVLYFAINLTALSPATKIYLQVVCLALNYTQNSLQLCCSRHSVVSLSCTNITFWSVIYSTKKHQHQHFQYQWNLLTFTLCSTPPHAAIIHGTNSITMKYNSNNNKTRKMSWPSVAIQQRTLLFSTIKLATFLDIGQWSLWWLFTAGDEYVF